MIGLLNGSKQGDKSVQHSKLVRNVAAGFSLAVLPLTKIPCSFYARLWWWLRHQKSTPGTRIPPAMQATPGVFVGTAWPHCGAFASFPKNLTNAWQLPSRGNKRACNWLGRYSARLQVVPHFSSGIVEWAKCERARKSSHARKGNTRQGDKNEGPSFFLSPSRVAFSCIHGVIFMCTHVFLALLSLRDYTRSLYSADQLSGAPNVNFRKISVRKRIWNLEFSEHLL